MNHAEAIRYLDRHVNLEARAGRVEGLSLEPVEQLLHVLGEPHGAYRVVHVTGTNGKGSVVAMVSRLLEASGLRVGRFTSPHLERVNERIVVDGEPIDDESLAAAIGAVAAAEEISGVEPSYFEILVAAAFHHFADAPVEVAVVEVGLLGRWDATNVVDADVAVVTNVGKDHTDGAEGWELAVAGEKAGIIKEGSVPVLGVTDPALVEVFEREAAVPSVLRDRDFGLDGNRLAVGGRLLDAWVPDARYDELFVPLHGAHQGDNAVLALAAAGAFFGNPVDESVVGEAWRDLALPSRLEVVAREPLVLLDGAHNPPGARALARALGDFEASPRVVVLGLLDGRDPDEMVAALGIVPGDPLVVTRPRSPRAMDPSRLAQAARALGADVDVLDDPYDALDAARTLAGERGIVVVSGSFYLTGALRAGLMG